MAIWFRKSKLLKWHIACYGGSIAECGRDIRVAAAYATERKDLAVDEAKGKEFCQVCINSIMRGREYIRQLEERAEKKLEK
jgi:hypothetical protein